MAGKEATVYIVDVGSTMREHGAGREESNSEWALQYVWDKLTTTIATGRKTLLLGVVALRSNETQNELSDDEHYKNISVLQDLAQLQMPGLRDLISKLVPGEQNSGDIVSAMVIAIEMISKACKTNMYTKRIILVTDARAPMASDDLSQIAAKIKDDKIELTVLGVDFDDTEYGFKEEDKDGVKASNEEILRQMCTDTNGIFGTMAQAIDELSIPRIKSVRPVQSYRGFLTLGDSEQYEDALNISVERYPKTSIAAPPSASNHAIRTNLDATQVNEDDLTTVKNTRTYQIKDQSAPGGKREVDFEELAKGYEYGRTAVHISESDQNVTNFETAAGLDIIGFVDANQHERFTEMTKTYMILPERGNDKSAMALSSFIHALFELDSFAVARLVVRENKDPSVVLLSPHIEADFECLYEVELPFAEDMRLYRFPPLGKVITVSGKTITTHRTLPSDELQKAMDDLVDSMDLSEADKDDEGNPCEYMPLDEVYSPVVHHLTQSVKQRAIYPAREPPPPAEILIRYAHPPQEVLKLSQSALEKAIKLADVKKVPPRARGKRWGKKEDKPLSDLDISALLASDPQRQQKKIDSRNALPEFKQLLQSTTSVEVVQDGAKQLQAIILDWIEHSVGDSHYGQALEAIKVMREQLDDLELPAFYNDFMIELKEKVLSDELGGERKDLWYLIRIDKQTGLISKRENSVSDISDEQAVAYKSSR